MLVESCMQEGGEWFHLFGNQHPFIRRTIDVNIVIIL